MEKYETILKQWIGQVCRAMDATDWMKEILAQDQLEDSDQTRILIIEKHLHHELSELLESMSRWELRQEDEEAA